LLSVVINEEGQFACVRAGWPPAPGWSPAGFTGSREECVAWVDEHWTDMRPASLRAVRDGEP
jgi:MbtH protein